MDIVFVIDGDAASQLPQNSRDRTMVSVFSQGPTFHAQRGLRLDTYVLAWRCIPDLGNDVAGLGPGYYGPRGRWDDFWQRNRTTPKGSPPVPADCPPRRGYLEVKLGDYPS